jgi:hypothetical protein
LSDSWPPVGDEDAYSLMRTSEVETLLISGDLDTSTPPQVAATELLPYLPNGHHVVLPRLGHTASFFAEQPAAGSQLINAFFDSGQVDASVYTPQNVDLTPALALTTLAKWIAGIMVGLALLTVLSLLWVARRVRRRGGFGSKASAALRSLYPVVLGLGGWSLAVLIILSGGLSVPLDSEALAVVAMGIPIALGVYGGWVRPDRSTKNESVGLTAAAGGALFGAWLGINATGGLFALFAAIAGAVAGANLALIVLDVSTATAKRRGSLAPSLPVERAHEPVRP